MVEARSAEAQLQALGIVLPVPPTPIGRFCHGRIEGRLLFLSGQGPLLETGVLAVGKVGREVTPQEAHHHAMRVGLVLLGAARRILGSLDRIECVVKLLGFVNAVPEFEEHARVIDGCSEIFHQVFGPDGVHARSAIGVASLPGGITVEVEAVLSVVPAVP